MRKLILTGAALLVITVAVVGGAQSQRAPADVRMPPHPRLLLLRGEEQGVSRDIAADSSRRRIHLAIIAGADELQSLPPVERIKIGRRLLDKSREALRRLFLLSYAARLTGNERYAKRAESEMLAIANFSDWNPTHFLDVAEMTMAMSIGYDWLYDKLADSSRAKIRNAIISKGLEPSRDSTFNSWLRVSNNWNQVCNAGMTFGALAVYESEPEASRALINRAIASVVLPMEDYAPDGAYPEGYGYWDYGTSFNVMLLGALERVFGEDFGLSARPGFLATGAYMANMAGPTGSGWNYADAGAGGEFHPAMFYFAAKARNPALLWTERATLMRSDARRLARNRLLPAAMIFGRGIDIAKAAPPATTTWTGNGKNPVAMMRTSWMDPAAIFVGVKGGSAGDNHAHMDAGSFVMEADGVRWAMDFGADDYNQLETAGVDLWTRTQASQRWQVFRYNNKSHTTLTVNDSLHVMAGRATIASTSALPKFMHAIVDLTPVFGSSLSKAVRGIAIVDGDHVVVRDELATGDRAATIRWNMVTPAAVTISGPNSAELTKDGKKLVLRVTEPATVTMKTWSTIPAHAYDSPNPGTSMVGFEITLPAGSRQALTVLLTPEKAANRPTAPIPALSGWPTAK
ncbi:MAG: heparinase II/III family protein [bacterium]